MQEQVRSCTPESDAMCKTLIDSSASMAQKVEALQLAVKNHGTITRQALMGAGWCVCACACERSSSGAPACASQLHVCPGVCLCCVCARA